MFLTTTLYCLCSRLELLNEKKKGEKIGINFGSSQTIRAPLLKTTFVKVCHSVSLNTHLYPLFFQC